MRNPTPAPVALSIRFFVGRLSPRGLRRRFIDVLRIEIARGRVAGTIDPEISEELWRALPAYRARV